MTHFQDNTQSDLDSILSKLIKNHISYSLRQKNGIIIMIDTKNSELLDFAKKNNPKLR